MSTFAQKALLHVSSTQAKLSILEGREGVRLQAIATRLRSAYGITSEQIEDYYDAFIMFPLDSNQRISPMSILKFYSKAEVELSEENCLIALREFCGIQNTESLDFETYVMSMEKWMKKVFYIYSSVGSFLFGFEGDPSQRSIENGIQAL
jgi:hypothetical protein